MEQLFSTDSLIAASAIVLHVAHYNASAHVEHATRIYTKVLGRNAVYFYAVLLIVCALVRDHFIYIALHADEASLPLDESIAGILSKVLIAAGVLLNLWTFQVLGIKGMYNGDSFGFLMDAPVTHGPFAYLSDPQYVGTTMALLGAAVQYRSVVGMALTVLMGAVFHLSTTYIEGPHMMRLYGAKDKKS